MINLQEISRMARYIANDNDHGYSQTRRNNGKEGDCSSNTLKCLRAAGFVLSGASYTGNMLKPLLKEGFKDVTSSVNLRTGEGLKEYDVCLRPASEERGGHVVVILAKNGKEIFQNDHDFDGRPGDSSKKEIYIRPYYDSPFLYALRYPSDAFYDAGDIFFNSDSKALKTELNRIGYKFDVTQQFGPKCWEAVEYEKKNNGITESGIGPDTWKLLRSLPTRK